MSLHFYFIFLIYNLSIIFIFYIQFFIYNLSTFMSFLTTLYLSPITLFFSSFFYLSSSNSFSSSLYNPLNVTHSSLSFYHLNIQFFFISTSSALTQSLLIPTNSLFLCLLHSISLLPPSLSS